VGQQEDSVVAERKARMLIAASNQAGQALEEDATSGEVMRWNLPFLDEAHAARQNRDARLLLLDAGFKLLVALDSVAKDAKMWRCLGNSELRLRNQLLLSFEQEMRLREILAHDIPQVLLNFGYKTPPPPPVEQWSAWLQGSFSVLLSSGPDEAGVGRRAHTAECELIYFVMRFRRLLEDAKGFLEVERMGEARQEIGMRRLMSAVVRAGRERAVPAALGAGAAAAVAGPLGLAAGATTGAAVAIGGAAASELLKVVVEGVAAAGLSDRKVESDLPATPSQRRLEAYTLVSSCVQQLSEGKYDRSDLESGRLQFLIRRGVFDTLQSLDDGTIQRVQAWAAADRLLRALNAADWTGAQQHTDELRLHLGSVEVYSFLAVQQNRLRELERARERDRQEEQARQEERERAERQHELERQEELERQKRRQQEEEEEEEEEEEQRRQAEQKSQQRYMER
jgi:hypothetical protein